MRNLQDALKESGFSSEPDGGTPATTQTVDTPAAPAGSTDTPGGGPTITPDPAQAVATPETVPPTSQPANNSDVLKGIFGDEWSDPVKIKEAITKSQRDLLSEIKDDEIRELVKATSSGITKQAYESYKKIGDLGKLASSDKIALKLQMEKGYSAEDAKFYVDNLYKFGEDLSKIDPQDPNYASIRIAQMEGQEQARIANDWLAAKKEELSTPPTQVQLKNWKPQIPKLVAEHGKIEMAVDGIDGKFIYPINPKKVAEMESFLEGIVGQYNGFPDPNSAEAINWAKGAIQNQLYATENAAIFNAYRGWIQNKELEKNVNPSSIKEIPGSQALNPGNQSNEDAFAEQKRKERIRQV